MRNIVVPTTLWFQKWVINVTVYNPLRDFTWDFIQGYIGCPPKDMDGQYGNIRIRKNYCVGGNPNYHKIYSMVTEHSGRVGGNQSNTVDVPISKDPAGG